MKFPLALLIGTLALTGFRVVAAPAGLQRPDRATHDPGHPGRELEAPAGHHQAAARPGQPSARAGAGGSWVQLTARVPAASTRAALAGAGGRALLVQPPAAAPRTGLHLTLVNVLGSVVYQRALPTAAPVAVPTRAVPTGLYWVQLRGPQGYQLTRRLVLS